MKAIDAPEGVAKVRLSHQRGHAAVKQHVAAGSGSGKSRLIPASPGHGEIAKGVDIGKQRIGEQHGTLPVASIGIERHVPYASQRMRRIGNKTAPIIQLGKDFAIIKFRI